MEIHGSGVRRVSALDGGRHRRSDRHPGQRRAWERAIIKFSLLSKYRAYRAFAVWLDNPIILFNPA